MKTIKKFDLFIYLLTTLILGLFLFIFLKTPILKDFLSTSEAKTFDLRQQIISNNKTPKKNVSKIFALDTKSYEFLTDTYGMWPVERKYWADLINEIEKYNPNLIVLDFMYPKKSLKGGINSDKALIDTINKNNNIISSMLFDNDEERITPNIPEYLSFNIDDDNYIQTNPRLNFTNYQPILKEILMSSHNIASVNFTREQDGITRYMPVFIKYKEKYYPTLSFLAGFNYLSSCVSKGTKCTFGMLNSIENGFVNLSNGYFIPINDSGRAIMNWYKNDTFEHISLSDIHKAIKSNDTKYLKEKIQGNVIFIGATAPLLNDIKSSPINSMTAGIEVHATFFTNMINNDFIFHVPLFADILISIILSLITIFFVNKFKNVFLSFILTLSLFISYFILSTLLMNYFNLWIGILLPFSSSAIYFIVSYILKYILKSKDYEQTYKLAVTDVMTQLYNHRYFQEQMILNSQNFKRYNTEFSLIMTDIDFFKKFNDTYGHQSGDDVLKQVALVIKNCVRATDIPCRYGGEEMAVILTNTKFEDAVVTANKICEAIRNTKVTLSTGDIVNVTISVGVSTVSDECYTPEDIIKVCDTRLYKAKENGRNQVVAE